MGRAKEIVIRVIPRGIANEFVKKNHYSGKIVQNSSLHFGAFLGGRLHGVLQYGPSMDKRKIIGLVKDTGWNEFIELNRMAFDDVLPRNAESYCIAKTLRLIKKNAPHVKWVISFADATQCGDGTIYRASNFLLTGITKNTSIIQFPSGDRVTAMTITACPNLDVVKKQSAFFEVEHRYRTVSEWIELGARYIPGYQLRYIFFIDRKCIQKLTVPILPFSKIDEMGAGMYKGENIKREDRHLIKNRSQIDREAKTSEKQAKNS